MLTKHDAACETGVVSPDATHKLRFQFASRFYRRLLQMGVNNAELWTNLGLCCYYASQ